MKQHIYADNAATTQMDKAAFDAMVPWLLEQYGNASQPYAFSREPKKALTTGLSRVLLFQIVYIEQRLLLPLNITQC